MVTKGIININKPEKYSTDSLLLFFTSKENTGTKPQKQMWREENNNITELGN